MGIEIGRPWAWAALAAAALFASGALVAVVASTDRLGAEASAAGASATAMQERYRAAAAEVDAWEAQRAEATCTQTARTVGAVALEARTAAAVDDAASVASASLVVPLAQRESFEAARADAAEALATGFATDADAALAAEYEGVRADVRAACLAVESSPSVAAPGVASAAAVEAMEARAAELAPLPEPDVQRFDELDAQLLALASPVLAVVDARIAAAGLDSTDAALGQAADVLRAAEGPAQALLALEALAAHADAANAEQARLAAAEAARIAAEQVQQAPPAAPPAQTAAPEPSDPAAPPEPEPSPPGDGDTGDGGGDDAIIDPLVP